MVERMFKKIIFTGPARGDSLLAGREGCGLRESFKLEPNNTVKKQESKPKECHEY